MATIAQESRVDDAVRGRMIYVLGLVILVQTIYPMTLSESPYPTIAYNILNLTFVFFGVLIARERPRDFHVLRVMAVIWLLVQFVFAFNQQNVPVQLIAYLAFTAFEVMVIKVLLQFVFLARSVSLDVLYAAVAVYFLLGGIFVPVYGLIETATFQLTGAHAFSDPTAVDTVFLPWQTFVYYSYATLTTLGYGDILPLTAWARSAASLEAIVGVLYLTIIMARLVSLYVSREAEEDAG